MVFTMTSPPPIPPRHAVPSASTATAGDLRRAPPPPPQVDYIDAHISCHGHRAHAATQLHPIVAGPVDVHPFGGSVLSNLPPYTPPARSDNIQPVKSALKPQTALCDDDNDDCTTVLSSTLSIKRRKQQRSSTHSNESRNGQKIGFAPGDIQPSSVSRAQLQQKSLQAMTAPLLNRKFPKRPSTRVGFHIRIPYSIQSMPILDLNFPIFPYPYWHQFSLEILRNFIHSTLL